MRRVLSKLYHGSGIPGKCFFPHLDARQGTWNNYSVKRIVLTALAALLLASCAPVLNRDLMQQGGRQVPFDQMVAHPDAYQGKLFILGGLIVDTRLIPAGSRIEAVFVPVDSSGYLEDVRPRGRFRALLPEKEGLLDPVVFRQGREVTLAAEFAGTEAGKIDERDYTFPLFTIKEIYLWPRPRPVYPYDPWYYPSPFLTDPWGRPYPGPFWPGW